MPSSHWLLQFYEQEWNQINRVSDMKFDLMTKLQEIKNIQIPFNWYLILLERYTIKNIDIKYTIWINRWTAYWK